MAGMTLSLSSSAEAQGFRLSGRVLGVHGPDTVPVNAKKHLQKLDPEDFGKFTP